MNQFSYLKHCLLIGLISCLVMVPAPGQESGAKTDEDLQAVRPLYTIQPNDILDVFVWKEPELSRKVLVRPDGRISFPLLGDIPVAGVSTEELTQKIGTLLGEFIEAPHVTVIVDAIRHYRVYVTGNVLRPGVYEMETPVTVLQALTLAGGFQEFADQSDVKVLRSYGREHVFLDFNYKDVIKGKRTEQNIVLKSGDVVVVP